MAVIRYVTDGSLYFMAIVADDQHVTYLWPPDEEEPWFEDARAEMMLGDDEPPPTDAATWASVASRHLGNVDFEDSEVQDFEAAVQQARQFLSDNSGNKHGAYGQARASRAWDEVSIDYPNLGEDDDQGGDLDPAATLQWVLQTLGPIDPNGPNGWILRAADGNPQPGDEQEYVHWDAPVYNPPVEVASE